MLFVKTLAVGSKTSKCISVRICDNQQNIRLYETPKVPFPPRIGFLHARFLREISKFSVKL
jgi:hypothetical protein